MSIRTPGASSGSITGRGEAVFIAASEDNLGASLACDLAEEDALGGEQM